MILSLGETLFFGYFVTREQKGSSTLDFTIGEFSRISGLSIKALRLYHEKGILIPGHIDPSTNYRYYDEANMAKAKIILYLRDMELSLADIKDILNNFDDEANLVDALARQKEIISDARLLTHLKSEAATIQLPFRESYIKGPGLIIGGDPKKFLTEVQIMVEEG